MPNADLSRPDSRRPANCITVPAHTFSYRQIGLTIGPVSALSSAGKEPTNPKPEHQSERPNRDQSGAEGQVPRGLPDIATRLVPHAHCRCLERDASQGQPPRRSYLGGRSRDLRREHSRIAGSRDELEATQPTLRQKRRNVPNLSRESKHRYGSTATAG
jgi:hypothetical protein